ncbi:hypothetical protein NLD30_10970 [SCandidatus Aminicenantes bacterium Aminicenantia_JdfR_composite]|jgi:hypothetical protein|nr:hypothetical protein [SCandidatus Aminicenantes bacterium Aminicenantia_JdfR_composite]MCP2598715.1 hypothetical protein [Candidatus Aminicenantes bacterium AC-335-L06]
MFEVLFSLEKGIIERTDDMKLGVEPCIELWYGFIVPCGCCIKLGGCGTIIEDKEKQK